MAIGLEFERGRQGKGAARGVLRRLLAAPVVVVMAGALTTVATATPASAATTWIDVSAGYRHTCGVTSSRDLWCWGDNSSGQLGVGSQRPPGNGYTFPMPVGPRGVWASVSAGRNHTCALRVDGMRYCWGDNSHGKLGLGDLQKRFVPAAADSGWATVRAGWDHTCGITTGGVAYCWGSNQSGELGYTSERRNEYEWRTPRPVLFNGRWKEISAGYRGTCGLDSQGVRHCWGSNASGALGLGKENSAINSSFPTPVGKPDEGAWNSVDLGESNGCGITKGKSLFCWGDNAHGRLGVGDLKRRYIPTRVQGSGWSQVTMGQSHTCGLRTDGVGYCWGGNDAGQLAMPPVLGEATTPHAVYLSYLRQLLRGDEEPMIWSTLSAGGSHTCGIRSDGVLFCWGDNTYGQLGDGTTAKRSVPRQIA